MIRESECDSGNSPWSQHAPCRMQMGFLLSAMEQALQGMWMKTTDPFSGFPRSIAEGRRYSGTLSTVCQAAHWMHQPRTLPCVGSKGFCYLFLRAAM